MHRQIVSEHNKNTNDMVQTKNRTSNDWSKHEVAITKFDGVLIHHIKKINGSSDRNVKFINAGGILAVTGDYGNWIFCREFHPSKEGGVSDGYWNEKLKLASCQEPFDFDSEATKEQLKNEFSEYKIDNTIFSEDNDFNEKCEYYSKCIELCDEGELDYTHYAYRERPNDVEYEDVVFIKTEKIWLKCVYDAFDEICRRYRENEITT